MKKTKSVLYLSNRQKHKKDNLCTSHIGITRRLLEKYKSSKNFIGIDGVKKEIDFNKAA